jgi:hypothetical protein
MYINLENYVIHCVNFVSMLFIWIYSGEGGVKFMKHFKGGSSYKILRTSELPSDVDISTELPRITFVGDLLAKLFIN